MFGSEILEVGIGLAFVYLLLSLVCSVVNEWIAGIWGLRASNLEAGIRSLFTDGTIKDAKGNTIAIADAIYGHGLIQSLSKTGSKPAYIPAKLFASALIDTLAPADANGAKAITEVQTAIAKLPDSPARQALLAVIGQAGNKLDEVRTAVESWYNDGMDRVAGWYKRKTQLILVCLALGITVLTNTDTVVVTKALLHSPTLRASAAAAAEDFAKKHNNSAAETADSYKQLRDQLQQLSLPIGWNNCPTNWPLTLLGWTLTTAAVSLGAPFWFDVLNKFMVVRSSIKPGEKDAK